jgi:hypothetical protein
MFWKMDLFESSSEEREAPTLLGSLEKANLNQNTLYSAYFLMFC